MDNETVSKNFIEQIIDKDIEEGHCQKVVTTPEEIARYAQTLGLLPSSNSGAGSSGSASSGIKYEPKSRGVYLGGKVERGEISKWDAVKDIIDNFQGDELAMRRAAQSAGVLDLLMQRYK